MVEGRVVERRRGERRKKIQQAKKYLGMERRVADRRLGENRACGPGKCRNYPK
jgi:hypothetical protein